MFFFFIATVRCRRSNEARAPCRRNAGYQATWGSRNVVMLRGLSDCCNTVSCLTCFIFVYV